MIETFPSSDAKTVRLRSSRRSNLLKSNMRLQTEIAALIEDNKQLRAALRIFSEVARKSPACLSLPMEQLAC